MTMTTSDTPITAPLPTPLAEQSIVDHQVAMLIGAGAAVAVGSTAAVHELVTSLMDAGVAEELVRGAIEIGRVVRNKPASVMKEAADMLAGTELHEPQPGGCPAERLRRGLEYNQTMLVSVGAAMAANCEPCLNLAVPNLIEAGVNDADIRAAVEIGQHVKDRAAALVEHEATALLAGRRSAALRPLESEPAPCGCN